MNTLTRNCFLGLLLALTLSACVPLAKTEAEYRKLTSDPNSKIIHSLEDFDKKAKNGILAKLDPAILKSFRDSLRFNNNGLGPAEIGQIRMLLSRRQFYRVMGFFGMAAVFVEMGMDLECCPNEPCCRPRIGHICTRLCV